MQFRHDKQVGITQIDALNEALLNKSDFSIQVALLNKSPTLG